MRLQILKESRNTNRIIQAEQVVYPHMWKRFRVKVITLHLFKDKKSCLDFFDQIQAGNIEP